jgi:hypothetical protein
MTDERKNKMLETVRKLLAKANDSAVGDAEAEVFRQKADELMTAYAIESWEVEMAKEGQNILPVKREFDFSWWSDTHESWLRAACWTLWGATARHCRVISVSKHWDLNQKTIPVVGMEADIDYFDMLFTSLLLQLTSKADPRPQESLSLEENLAAMREAGYGWDTVTRRLIEAGHIEDPNPGVAFPRERADWKHFCRERFLLSERLVRRYRAWCKETGRPQTYTNVKTYREHFAAGFAYEIDSRLARMRRESEQSYDAAHTGNSAALALRDINALVKEALWEFFPDLRPHPANCECDNCHTAKCNDPKCSRPRCVARRKPVRYKTDTRKIDWSARNAGARAGAEANLHGNPSRGLRRTPEIGS